MGKMKKMKLRCLHFILVYAIWLYYWLLGSLGLTHFEKIMEEILLVRNGKARTNLLGGNGPHSGPNVSIAFFIFAKVTASRTTLQTRNQS
ncbi:hypothetical protein Sjap_015118 [Stephania japonica]|uniref:Transmembrane protein n=1 Tax=Stephania japonica TaxID=461633 RepID=A0AAP0NTP6_9MAGN